MSNNEKLGQNNSKRKCQCPKSHTNINHQIILGNSTSTPAHSHKQTTTDTTAKNNTLKYENLPIKSFSMSRFKCNFGTEKEGSSFSGFGLRRNLAEEFMGPNTIKKA